MTFYKLREWTNDKKSTGNSEKVKDVEVDMIERSIRMEEEAKTKIHEMLIV